MGSVRGVLLVVLALGGASDLLGQPVPPLRPPGREPAREHPRRAIDAFNLSGPRLGFTAILPGSPLADAVREHDMGLLISQFGWHVETNIQPVDEGPSFVMQHVLLLGGVEYGRAVPSATFMVGLRSRRGVELGMGPNLLLGGADLVSTAFVVGAGRVVDYGDVQIPFNAAVAVNPDGVRVSMLVGYAVRSRLP